MNRRRFLSLAAGSAAFAAMPKPIVALAPEPGTITIKMLQEAFARIEAEPKFIMLKARQLGMSNFYSQIYSQKCLTSFHKTAKVDFDMKNHSVTNRAFTQQPAANTPAQGSAM